jgi:hypothetical protein
MRHVIVYCLLFLTTAFAADPDLAGRHAGEWKSASSGNGGAIRFTLDSGTGGTWKCDLSFDLDGANVKTVMREVKVEGAKVEFTYDFDVQGLTLRSHVLGEWKGTAFSGRYETTAVADGSAIDGGTWNASRVK